MFDTSWSGLKMDQNNIKIDKGSETESSQVYRSHSSFFNKIPETQHKILV